MILYVGWSVGVAMIRSNCTTNKYLEIRWSLAVSTQHSSCVVSKWLIVVLCHVIAHGFSVEVKQRRARLVPKWVTDRGLSHMHGFSGKITRWVTLTYDYEWPDDFCTVGDTLTLPSRVTEGWIFNVSGLAIIYRWDWRDATWRGITGASGQLVHNSNKELL